MKKKDRNYVHHSSDMFDRFEPIAPFRTRKNRLIGEGTKDEIAKIFAGESGTQSFPQVVHLGEEALLQYIFWCEAFPGGAFVEGGRFSHWAPLAARIFAKKFP